MIRCRHHPCREPGHYIDGWQAPFCRAHYEALTPLKQREIAGIRHFNVFELGALQAANRLVTESRRYLASKENRKHQHG